MWPVSCNLNFVFDLFQDFMPYDFFVQGHSDWKKFRPGLPEYLPEMDRMFEGVAVDGSASFVATAEEPIECDSSDEADGDEQEDELTPLSVGNKRTSPSKKSKSPAVRAMVSNMREYNVLQRSKISLMQSMLQVMQDVAEAERKAAEAERRAAEAHMIAAEAQANAHEMKIKKVLELAGVWGHSRRKPKAVHGRGQHYPEW
jgi:hypothetical protein